MAQLDATYGKDVARSIITNHALQIIYAPREQQDANDYSEMLGYTTVRKQNLTRGRDISRNESEERRALMLRSEEHTSELQSLMRISYAVFCLKKNIYNKNTDTNSTSRTNID